MADEPKVFVLRRGFVVPLTLLVLLTLILLCVLAVQSQPLAKMIILALLLVPLGGLAVESARRRLLVDESGVTALRLLRSRRVNFVDVTSLEAVRVRSRIFLTLVAGDDDFLIISNSYAGFAELLTLLLARLPAEAVTPEAQALAESKLGRSGDIITAWFAVAAMIYILLAQFR